MKKLFALLAAVILISATGCQKTKEAEIPPLPEQYSTAISMSYAGTDTKAVLTRNAHGAWGIDVVEPEILDPLTFSSENGETSVSLDGMPLSNESSRFPQKDLCSMLFEALEQVYSGAAVQSPVNDGNITYSGKIDGGEYTLTRNAGDGSWIRFTVNEAQADILFSEFKAQ